MKIIQLKKIEMKVKNIKDESNQESKVNNEKQDKEESEEESN